MQRRAIVSVYDKTGLEPFARGLLEKGFSIISSGGTAKFLQGKGIEILPVSDFTGYPEICSGRVKTLHPKVHGGILARRDISSDLNELKEIEGHLIDIVVVNLYPFVDKVAEVERAGESAHGSLVESIDIGGPTMLRAAAKNCKDVIVVSDPSDYDKVLGALDENSDVPLAFRRKLAEKVFKTMASYDASIARYFSLEEKLLDENAKPVALAPIESVVLEKTRGLRYGENPHQQAALYRKVSAGTEKTTDCWKQLQGKELSYNNLMDMQAALDLFVDVWDSPAEAPKSRGEHVCVVMKHQNPCGAAVRATSLEAFVDARDCDALSAFGGIVAVSGEVDEQLAKTVNEGFIEVFLAQSYTSDALALFSKKKNLRLIEVNFDAWRSLYYEQPWMIRNFSNYCLLQEIDRSFEDMSQSKVVTTAQPSAEVLKNLQFAWQVCQHVKSNTILIAKDMKAIGVGAGQMSRVDAAKIAVARAKEHGHSLDGAVAASDAFLPFPDALEILNDAGISALAQPGGSIKDELVTKEAEKRSMVMLTTGKRHFRH